MRPLPSDPGAAWVITAMILEGDGEQRPSRFLEAPFVVDWVCSNNAVMTEAAAQREGKRHVWGLNSDY